jgi:hypothetical protein
VARDLHPDADVQAKYSSIYLSGLRVVTNFCAVLYPGNADLLENRFFFVHLPAPLMTRLVVLLLASIFVGDFSQKRCYVSGLLVKCFSYEISQVIYLCT